jgi:hypothetical protein
MNLPGGGPPDPEIIRARLLQYIKPPIPPWLIQKFKEAADARREALGLGAPWEQPGRERKERTISGHRMIWPYRIVWNEYESGKGQIKVLENEKSIGQASYWDRVERERLVNLFQTIIKSGTTVRKFKEENTW